MADTQDITIKQGKTFSRVLRWGTKPVVRKPITGISLDSGAPRLTVVGHGLKNGWPAYVSRVKGMVNINALNNPPKPSDYKESTVIDPDTIEFNEVTPVDANGREWPAWTSGGFLEYNTPVDLSGYTARIKIKNKVGGTVLASNDPADGVLNVITVAIDDATKTITLTIAASATDDFAWTKGVYELEMVSASNVVTDVMSGNVVVTKEVAV